MYCKYLHIIVFLVLHLTHLTGFFSTNKQNNKLVRDWILSQILCVTSVGYWCGQVRVSGDCRHQQQGLQSDQPTGIMRSLKKGTVSRDFRHFLVKKKLYLGSVWTFLRWYSRKFAKTCVRIVIDYDYMMSAWFWTMLTTSTCPCCCWLR